MRCIALALLLTLAAPISAARAEDSALRGLSSAGNIAPWRAVGRLDVAGKGFCTATLIAQGIVLTAAHCVYKAGRVLDTRGMVFRAAYGDGRALSERGVRRVVIPEDFTDIDQTKAHPHDVALLELDRAIRLPQLAPFDVSSPVGQGEHVAVVSYAEGRDARPSVQDRCTALGRLPSVTVLTCDVGFGSSGAPVFQDGKVVGMVTAMADFRDHKVALAVDLPQPVRYLRGLLRERVGSPAASQSFKTVRP